MKKINSYGFWTALCGAIIILLNSIGKACGFEIESETASAIVDALCGVLVVLGIVKMPSKSTTSEEQNSESDSEENSNDEQNEK